MKLMLKPLFRCTLGLFILSMLISACISDYDFDQVAQVKWQPQYALPLINGALGVEHLLNDEDSSALRTYDDGLFYLVYEKQLESREIGDLIKIPDKIFSRSYSRNIPVVIPPFSQQVLYQRSEVIDLELYPEQLYEARLKQGSIRLHLYSSHNIPLQVQISFPSITQGGDSLVVHRTLSAYYDQTEMIDISGLNLDMTQAPPGYNQVPLNISVTASSRGEQIEVPETSEIGYTVQFQQIEPHFLLGYFGNQWVELPKDSLKVGPLGDSFGGTEISLKDTKIQLDLYNEYGIPVAVDLNQFLGIDQEGNARSVTTMPASPIIIQAPTIPSEVEHTTIQVTNASEIFNMRPEYLYYAAEATINPADVNQLNFLTDTSKLKINIKAEVPLYGSAKGLILEDTLEAPLGDDLKDVVVDKAIIKLKVQNEFPIGAHLQIYLADQHYQIFDSLLNEDQTHLIVGSLVDQEGNLNSPGLFDQEITLSNQKFERLLASEYLILKATMETSPVSGNMDYPDVKLKSQYKLHLNLGLQTHLNVSLNP
ncbi:MAG: hypothetical protein ACNS62_07130 [Candidatus Cyclobacteriaceae bacterium M3_2C_046]